MVWNFSNYLEATALCDDKGNTLTYRQLEEEGVKLFEVIRKRCLVLILCKNEIGSVMGYVSFINNKIVPMLVSSYIENESFLNLLNLYKPSYVWMPKSELYRFNYNSYIYCSCDYVLVKTNYKKDYDIYEELGLLLTTSGSTGSPKFVRQSYTNILDNALSIVQYLQLNCDEKPITTLPMNYTYGLSIINSHLLVGAKILLTNKSITQIEFWDFFKLFGATSFGGVPYTYEMLDKMKFQKMNIPSLKTMTQAGGKLTLDLHEKLARYAYETEKKFVVMYGQCEATARMGYLPANKAIEKKGSMGIAIPGGKFRLIDLEGKEIITPYTTGELVYEGKNVSLGYAEREKDLCKKDERKGILVTGDMAQFDEDGYYYIVGRKKRFLKIFGNRINLDEIEQLIKSRFGVECASAGIDDHMYIFLLDDSISDQVKNFLSLKTRINQVAFVVKCIKKIPKNEAGKILYNNLVKYYD